MTTKILVPLDGSDLAEKALPHAEALAAHLKGELLVARVAHPPVIRSDYGTKNYEAFIEAERKETATYLQMVEEKLADRPFPVRVLALDRNMVAEALLDLACEEAVNYMVLTTHGRSGLGRIIQGSVATKLLRKAPCPVLLININAS